MKQKYKRILLSLAFVAVCGILSAVEVKVDGITYEVNQETKTAILSYGRSCSGDIVIPEYITCEGVDCYVTSIESSAFHFSSLTSISIPNSVTSIGDCAFQYCSQIAAVHISDIASWCNISFWGDESNPLSHAGKLYLNGELVTDLVIPNSVTNIGDYAFYHCSPLASITIPSSVTGIGNDAFSGCSSLTSVDIGNSVTNIGNEAFRYCSSLTSVSIPNSVTSIGDYAFNGCSSLSSISIPNSVTNIGSYAFESCSSLSSVTIPNSLTSIGYRAFQNCSSLTSVIIPNSVKVISVSAFSDCSSLTSVTIGNSVNEISDMAFSNCSSLTSVHISDIAAWCYISFGLWGANPLSQAKNLYLNGELVTDLVIPNSVISIENNAFTGCSSISSVTIANTVTTIGEKAFSGCSSLSSVIIGNSVTSIGDYAFSGCSSLTSATVPNSVTTIGNQAFANCSSLTSVDIPNSVTSIGWYAFSDCSSLTSVDIPNSVTSIGWLAFANCSSLTSISIPNSLTSIENRVFEGCIGLTSVIIPNSVTSIGNNAFKGCISLSSVTIGNSITSIGTSAFANCEKLADVYCWAEDIPNTEYSAFNNSNIEYATLHIPMVSIEKYKYKRPWKDFGTIVAIEDSGFDPCVTPTISYENGEITFGCETEGVEYRYSIADADVAMDQSSQGVISLTATYEISVYATKAGMENSPVAKATLCWLQGELKQSDSITPVPNIPVLITTSDDGIQLSGLMGVDHVEFYSLTGEYLGLEPIFDGIAAFKTAQAFLIVKIGETTIKVKK